MGPRNFSIELDSPTGSFYAGTTVTGRVVFTLDKPKNVQAVKLKFVGEAEVSWQGTVQRTRRKADNTTETVTESVTFKGSEEYFRNESRLLGEKEIPIGDHNYPFSCTLPPRLPTSFEGKHGHIRYTIKAVLDRPWKFDHEVKRPFYVMAPYDLNYSNLAKEPAKIEKQKRFCCLCCKSGPLQLVVWIPQKGYVPGQRIPVTVEVDNTSNVDVNFVEAKLQKETLYTAQKPEYKTKMNSEMVACFRGEGCPAGSSVTWSNHLTIPSDPFVNIEGCSIIKIVYELVVETSVSGCHTGLYARVPIVLGSVPVLDGVAAPDLSPGIPVFPPAGSGIPVFPPAGGGIPVFPSAVSGIQVAPFPVSGIQVAPSAPPPPDDSARDPASPSAPLMGGSDMSRPPIGFNVF